MPQITGADTGADREHLAGWASHALTGLLKSKSVRES